MQQEEKNAKNEEPDVCRTTQSVSSQNDPAVHTVPTSILEGSLQRCIWGLGMRPYMILIAKASSKDTSAHDFDS